MRNASLVEIGCESRFDSSVAKRAFSVRFAVYALLLSAVRFAFSALLLSAPLPSGAEAHVRLHAVDVARRQRRRLLHSALLLLVRRLGVLGVNKGMTRGGVNHSSFVPVGPLLSSRGGIIALCA